MKRYFVILNLICLFALPFVSPYLFDRGVARNQTQSRVSFETHRGPKAHHATPSDNAEQKLNNFNNRFEAYFDELKQSPGALHALLIILGLSIITLLCQPLLALMATPKPVPIKKTQPAVPKKPQIASYKRHLLS
ncbi:hypothetical protein LSA01_11400 [Latilactobacillus sakei]|uniref:Uncharacterized protein n=1 Tax=Latilactobacillus sakei TaxID=1599 RepID=A0A9N7IZD7_LATSK|nr:hypothetical protein [Latilactobacillus sakei]AST83271.1 hypothetical protein LBS_01580 [Latilactobacillus sakei]AWZ45796.1 hypothetical protein CXB69_01860 [Latilactobacillus sakei]AYG16409.1 hypothetical protein CFK78_05430 [Latilactobacillus sakei]AYG25130.1 hypothetical protein CFM83_03165 [Latilactobacillus sakei]AYG30492.1 hypothetical protein CFK76_05450 [Latilactobacillus sakei]